MKLELNGVFIGNMPRHIGEQILGIIEQGRAEISTTSCVVTPLGYEDSYLATGKSETLFIRAEEQKFNIDLQLQLTRNRIDGNEPMATYKLIDFIYRRKTMIESASLSAGYPTKPKLTLYIGTTQEKELAQWIKAHYSYYSPAGAKENIGSVTELFGMEVILVQKDDYLRVA